ncbi:MAG: hypothetical protein IPP73_16495 [Chitinophagaceae bacterium]|nr:hypothetical protein [Chitinophagaceae bacterium]
MGARNGKDQQLTSSSFEKLNGTFSNLPADTNYLNRTLYCHFTNENKRKDSICSGVQYTVELLSTDSRSLTIALKTNETTVRKITLKGKYKEGYFKSEQAYFTTWFTGAIIMDIWREYYLYWPYQ